MASGGTFENNKIYSKLEELNTISSKPDFWKDNNRVKKIVKEKKLYENIIKSFKNSELEINNLKDLRNLGNEEKDQEVLEDCKRKLDLIYKNITC